MSLTVKIVQFQLPKTKSNLIARVEFRGKFVPVELCFTHIHML